MDTLTVQFNEIYRNKCFEIFENFRKIYLSDHQIEIKYQEIDISKVLNKNEAAGIIDNRGFSDCDGKVFLILHDKFFLSNQENITSTLLHELGHYFTNPQHIKLRNFLKKKECLLKPSKVNSNHNFGDGLYFVWRLLTLPLEQDAENWFNNKNGQLYKKHTKIYFDNLSKELMDYNKIDNYKLKMVKEEDIFYSLPQMVFQLLNLSQKANIVNDVTYKEQVKKYKNEILRFAEAKNLNNFSLVKNIDKIITLLSQPLIDFKSLEQLFTEINVEYILYSAHYIKDNVQEFLKLDYSNSLPELEKHINYEKLEQAVKSKY